MFDERRADDGNGPARTGGPEAVEDGPTESAAERRAYAGGIPSPTSPTLRRRLLLWGLPALGAAVLLPAATAATALRLSYAGDLPEGAHTRGRDAVWLGHAWVDGRKDDEDLARLGRRIEGTGVRDLYVHTGPLEHDGTLDASRARRSPWLLRAVRKKLPGVRVQAWLGDVLVYDEADERAGRGLRLANPASRRAVVASARQAMRAGFDGVHFDLEQMHSGNEDFLRLLDRLGPEVSRAGGVLSVAAHQIDPLPEVHRVLGAVSGRGKYWSQGYFGEVARRVDQIAMMSYDTWMQTESHYGGLVAHLTELALEVTPRGTDLLMGLPFFHTDNLAHRASAETVPAAVRGIRLGLGRGDVRRRRFGTAAYVDFAADEADWTAYRRSWCEVAGRKRP